MTEDAKDLGQDASDTATEDAATSDDHDDDEFDPDDTDEQVNILTAAINDLADAYYLADAARETNAPFPYRLPPYSPEPPIHPSITWQEMHGIKSLLHTIVWALKTGDRQPLDELAFVDKSVYEYRNERPRQGVDGDPQRFFLQNFARNVRWYHWNSTHSTHKIDDPAGFVRLSGVFFKEYDPAFANLDGIYAEECVKAITWGKTGSKSCSWIRAAAKLAVRVGAFGSDKLTTSEDDRVDTLDNRLTKLWRTRDTSRFPEPEEFATWIKARGVTNTPR